VTASRASAALALENVDVSAGRVRTVVLRLQPLALPVAVPAVSKPEVIPEAAAIPEAEAPPPRASLDLRPSPAPDAARDGGWWLGRKWTWVAAGSTVLLAAGAVTAGLVMQSKFNSLDKSCGSSSGNLNGPACSDGDVASVRSLEVTANVLWGIAGAAAVATGVLFYWEGRRISVSPLAGGTTGIVAAVRY
jgi:hypothetical protein